jgi:four helix bundle protein
MGRDHTKLRFFSTADELALKVYRLTEALPPSERFGMQSQLRRAAVSAAVNIIEGACRTSDRSYSAFLEISLGSASESRYLLELCGRLQLVKFEEFRPLIDDYTSVIKGLQALISKIGETSHRGRWPKADSR